MRSDLCRACQGPLLDPVHTAHYGKAFKAWCGLTDNQVMQRALCKCGHSQVQHWSGLTTVNCARTLCPCKVFVLGGVDEQIHPWRFKGRSFRRHGS